MIGQERIKNLIRVNTLASKNTPYPHTLFVAGYGMGKTSFAMEIVKGLKRQFIPAIGSSLKNADDAIDLLTNIQKNAIVFIDEIHSVNSKAEEVIYIAMENGHYYFEGQQIKLEPFTLIGATTQEKDLAKPFKSRFQNVLRLEPYSYQDISKIVLETIVKANKEVDRNAIKLITRASKFNPRDAKNIAKNCINYSIAFKKKIDFSLASRVLKESGIDRKGYNLLDKKYLEALRTFKREVGVGTLSAYIGVDRQTIIEDIEPTLIKKGIILLTSRGRVLASQKE